MSALLALVPWYYRWLAILIALVAAAAFGAAKMHGFMQDKIDKLEKDIAVAEAAAAGRDAQRTQDSNNLINEKDRQHEDNLARYGAAWARELARVQHDGGAGQGAQPVRTPSTICGDPARDNRLSSALAAARGEARQRLVEYRAGVGRLLAACQLQTGDLVIVQDWAQHEQLLNAVPSAPPASP